MDEALEDKETRNDRTYFLRQLHVSSGVWTLSFVHGLATGAPTVFIPQIRRDWNTTVTIDDELASWIYSTSHFAALPWIFVLPALSQLLGRKIPYVACCIAMSTVFTLLYFSSAPYQILLAEAVHGFANATMACIIIQVIPEYCNHRYRNMYLNIQSTSFYWGMWASNAIGTYLDWKYIAVVGLICSLYTLTVSFYPESPRWLASKGKFTKCKAAHRWIHGCSVETEKELRDIIKSHVDFGQGDSMMTCTRLMKTLTSKLFYMPLFLILLAGAQYNFSGKLVCSIYSIEVLKKITNNENAAYTGMLVMDGVSVFGMYAGSVLSKFLKMRTLFFSLSFLSICVMFTFSLYLYLANVEVIRENHIVTLVFLTVYSLTISGGPIFASLSIYSELISIKYQAISYTVGAFFSVALSTGMLKFSPVIFSEFGIHGSFLFYAITCVIITILLYVYLPEVKNKTLEEIEEYFKDSKRNPEEQILTKPAEVTGPLDMNIRESGTTMAIELH